MEKDRKIEAKAEDVAAFNSIKTSAEVILGSKEAEAGEKLKEAYLTKRPPMMPQAIRNQKRLAKSSKLLQIRW